MTRYVAVTVAVLSLLVTSARGQGAIRKLVRDGVSPTTMTTAELAELRDPLFQLVLKDHPTEIRLDEIERLLLDASGTKRHLFVVDENLQDPARSGSRRAVIAFSGTNQGFRLDPNVMLSPSFTDQRFIDGVLEAWGWDDAQSRYNYYKLDGAPPSWKFRGSSIGADGLTPAQREGTCMACHINGAPVMKELPFPWNNWHSFRNVVPHLLPTTAQHWPVADQPRFRDLKGAEDLETSFILPSIRQFNGRRLRSMGRPGGSGTQEVTDGSRLLRPLFQTTEYNIISAGQLSGLHPFSSPGSGPNAPIAVPDTFFLNADLLAGGGIPQYEGLGIDEARQFGSLLAIQPNEYRRLISTFQMKLGDLSGDTNFAWFSPQASHVDNHMIDLLITQGVITKEFAAAVLAVDIEVPAFSEARAKLLTLVPPQFTFTPRQPGDVPAAHPDGLTRAVVLALRTTPPQPGTPEADFLALLENAKPLDVLRQRVVAYLDRVRATLSNSQQRASELDRLYRTLLSRRQDAIAHNPTLVESPRLFPRSGLP